MNLAKEVDAVKLMGPIVILFTVLPFTMYRGKENKDLDIVRKNGKEVLFC